MKWLLFAWKNVLRNRRRTAITIVLTAVGTAAVLMSSGFALYTYQSLKEMAARQSGHVVLAARGGFDNDDEKPLQHGLTGAKALREELLKDPRVATVLPRVSYSGLLSNGDKSAIFIGTGVDPEGEFRINGALTKVLAGRRLTPNPDPDAVPEVMIAKGLAKTLHAKPGDGLTLLSTTAAGALNGIDVQVVGIYSTGTPELDERALMTSIDTAQSLIATDKVSTLSIYLFDLDQAKSYAADLARRLPGLELRTWDQLAFFYAKVRALYNRIFGVLGIIIAVMVFFAVTNTMTIAVTERTREIGTLAALGTSPQRLVANFAMEAGLIGVIGSLFGMLIAGGVTILLHIVPVMMPPPPGRTEGYPLYLSFEPSIYLQVAVLMSAVAVVAAWLAARRGARKPIVEALSHV